MSKVNVYEIVSEKILAELEKGNIPWEKPWTGVRSGAYSRSTGKPYSLLNQMLLAKPGEYLTFKQVQEAGGKVRKGEKSSIVVFWKQLPIEEVKADGEVVKKVIPMLKYYNVFHIDQCEGIEAKYKPENLTGGADPDTAANAIIADYSARENMPVEHVAGDRAYYSPARDKVVLPLMEQFKSTAEYYGTAFHELTHSTGHSSRLNRFAKGAGAAAFGSEEYGKEELVAEMGAAGLLNYCGLATDRSYRNNAAYIQSWMRAIRDDSKLIVSAAGKAEKAVNYILGGN